MTSGSGSEGDSDAATGASSVTGVLRRRLNRPIAASLRLFREPPVDLGNLSYETLTNGMLEIENLVE
jgi:hypothetical protein